MTQKQIRDLRTSAGMTQEQFAHQLGVTVATVNRWERGHTAPSQLAKLALNGMKEKAA